MTIEAIINSFPLFIVLALIAFVLIARTDFTPKDHRQKPKKDD